MSGMSSPYDPMETNSTFIAYAKAKLQSCLDCSYALMRRDQRIPFGRGDGQFHFAAPDLVQEGERIVTDPEFVPLVNHRFLGAPHGGGALIGEQFLQLGDGVRSIVDD